MAPHNTLGHAASQALRGKRCVASTISTIHLECASLPPYFSLRPPSFSFLNKSNKTVIQRVWELEKKSFVSFPASVTTTFRIFVSLFSYVYFKRLRFC